MNQYYTYILASHSVDPVLYIGVTNDLERRVLEHQTKSIQASFTAKYNCDKLVYFDAASDAESAITREKQLKRWHRSWKLNLIRQDNPNLRDLSLDWTQETLKPVQGDIKTIIK